MLSPILENIIIIVVAVVCVLGPAIVVASTGYAAIRALGRNPSAAPQIMLAMLIAFVFAEATALIVLLVVFQLFT